jgi:hypothetical protein
MAGELKVSNMICVIFSLLAFGFNGASVNVTTLSDYTCEHLLLKIVSKGIKTSFF